MTLNGADALRRVEAWYGSAIPSVLKRLAIWYGGSEERLMSFYNRFGWDIAIPPELFTSEQVPRTRLRLPTYHSDPVELLPVYGCYTRFGFLDLAPELGLPDELTMVISEPTSYDLPVYCIGPSLGEALSSQAANVPELQEPDLHEVFGFTIKARAIPATYNEYHPTSIPENYSYERSGPAGGVLAPVSAFDGGPPITINQDTEDHRGYISRAERALVAGYPATTIVVARQFRANYEGLRNIELDYFPHLMTLWAEAALMLGRPSHAAVVLALRDDPEFNAPTH